jgi:peptidoglycan hydrolase-like protein with peptidoglycan-binding domain
MNMAQVALSNCVQLGSNPGFYLEKNAAYAWDRAVAAFGKQVLLTGAWRSYEIQRAIFVDRYRSGAHSPVGDYRRWPRSLGGDDRVWGRRAGTAAAAVPGTSNHGGGVAVDVKTSRSAGDPGHDKAVVFTSWNDPDRTRFLRVAAEHGWRDTEGRSVGELWHLTYYPHLDKHRGKRPAHAGKPATPPKPVKPGKTKPKTPPTLRVGSKTTKNGWVGAVQWRVGAVRDGIYGKGTEKAVRAFQKSQGLPVTGVVDARTWVALLYGKDAVSPGDKGTARVLLVQLIVGADADAIYGAGTRARVENVQRYLGVTPDGYVGRETRQALLAHYTKGK